MTASREAFQRFLAYTVWIETPREVRLSQGLERDGEEARVRWEEWMAAEDDYVRREGRKPEPISSFPATGISGLHTGRTSAGSLTMVPEAPIEQTELGLVPKGEGWFVLNAREAPWGPGEGRGAYSDFEGEHEFSQVGSTSSCSRRASRWRCTTGRPTRRTSSCSPARRC